ncbi:MAG: hypothetical protein HIU91_14580 [Acidobacteria bacterium]|nr:hypothetical protein [Acidobacteriota bacterium]
MGRKRKAAASHTVVAYYLGGKQRPPVLKEEVWMNAAGEVTRYSLAYIDPEVYAGDNGRVLGYDNAHGRIIGTLWGERVRMCFAGTERC